MLLLGKSLKLVGSVEIGKEAVRQITVLHKAGGKLEIVAADVDGNAVRIER